MLPASLDVVDGGYFNFFVFCKVASSRRLGGTVWSGSVKLRIMRQIGG